MFPFQLPLAISSTPTKMRRSSRPASLWSAFAATEDPTNCVLSGACARVALCDLDHGSALHGRGEELRGRSVLIATSDQLTAGLALLELDGVARRIVLYPSDLSLQHIPFVMDTAEVDVIVSDRDTSGPDISAGRSVVACSATIASAAPDRAASYQTEWILLTSGTTGSPKLVLHTLASLAGAIEPVARPASQVVWGTFYDIRRYGGLQIFLRAILSGTSLVLSSTEEPTVDYLARAGSLGVTHISGTPSHWRHELMSPAASEIAPKYIRLSGEIVDQAILNQLRSFYPQAQISHAFASTEAGVAFDVTDGGAGFPAGYVEQRSGDVELEARNGSLRIRSNRTASRYLGQLERPLRDSDDFVDTGDMLELRDNRYYFIGRRDGVINVGGLKVHPEEVEAVINRHPRVKMCLVHTKKNPITGALVVAEVVPDQEFEAKSTEELRNEILQLCRGALTRYKVPAMISFVPALKVAATGKIVRRHA